MGTDKNSLEVIENCNGCGVCCLHMGYPAYMLPREPASEEQIASDEKLQQLLTAGWTRDELLSGHAGESYWHQMPDDLKQQWKDFVENYRRDGELDGPCFWFDMDTRLCRNHEHRPQVCRDFEAGSLACKQWRREYNELIR